MFISAKELEKSLGSRKRITFDELLFPPAETRSGYASPNWPLAFPLMHPEEVYYNFVKYYRDFVRRGLIPPFGFSWGDSAFQILGNVHFGRNINDTVADFSRLNVGEPVFAQDSAIPVNEFAYRLLNTVIRYIVRTEHGRLGQLMRFNADAPFFEEADLQGVRIGIVHTITEVAAG